MNIYTYYENVNFKKQKELLSLWSQSWENNGFSTKVLSRQDAERSSLYNDYYNFVQSVHTQVSGKELPENGYWLAAQLEIVAFTTIDSASYISDYDIINRSFNDTHEVSSMLHWRDNCCSCFASGDSKSWVDYVIFLMEHEDIIIEWCSQERDKTSRTEFGDQDFLIAIQEVGLRKNIFRMSRELGMCQKYFPNAKVKHKTYHISHRNMHEITSKYPKYEGYNQDELRIIMGKEICS